jgi:hypothetical protein
VTITAFTPNTRTIFGFQATLDGALYNVTVPWNVSRQGWYVKIMDGSGNLTVNTALVGSPPPPQNGVNLVGGYFTTSTMFYYPASGTFVVTP